MLEWLRTVTPAQSAALGVAYVMGIVLLGAGALIGLTKGGHAMATVRVTTTAEVELPAIDRTAPTETETATFSLG